VTTEALLAGRGKTHGDWGEQAVITQSLKDVMRMVDGWDGLTSSDCEALEMIAVKIGRILAGDPNHRDHWLDISGYAMLAAGRGPQND